MEIESGYNFKCIVCKRQASVAIVSPARAMIGMLYAS